MFESGRVLLIEDSPDEAALIIAMLDEGAFSCEWAPTLGEGCTVLRDRPPSCVLVDLGRPDADGLASLDEVVRVASEIPVIVLTGPDNVATGEVAVRHGAQDYLDKGWMDQRLLARSVRYAIERRAADRALGETSTRLSTALEAMLDGFGLFSAVRDADGELVDFTWDYVNAAGVATYGRSPGDLVGRRMCEVAPGIRESGLFDEYRRVAETGAALTLDALRYSDIGKGGTVDGTFDVHASKLGDGLVLVWREVSERRRQERALAEAKEQVQRERERFRAALESIPDGFGVFSAVREADGELVDFTWDYVNAAGAATAGRRPEELVGRRLRETSPAMLWDDYRRVAETGVTLAREAAVPDATFATNWYDVRAAKLGDGLVIAWRDVTALKQASGYARSLIEASQDPLETISAEGKITDVNAAAVTVTGVPREMLIGTDFADYFTEPDRAREGFRQVFARGSVTDIPLTVRHRDGRRTDLLCNASLYRDAAGNPLGVVAVGRDVTERGRQERALAEAKELFESAFDGAPIGIALVSLHPDTPGRYLQINGALCGLLGYPADDLVGRSVLDVTHPDDAADNATLLAQLAHTTIERYRTDKRYVHADGHPIWVRVHSSPVRDASGRPSYAITHVEDVTETMQAQERLAHQAMHDPLTGLANRHLLIARLQHSLDELGRTDVAVAVLYLDLDDFKTVNDSVGHGAGDRFLAEVGRRLASVVRRHDTAARIGGDEFVIVAGQLAADHDVARVIDRVQVALEPPIVIDGDTFAASASIGVVVTRAVDDDPSELLRAADTAMYRAKQAGRGRHEIFNETLRAEAIQRLDVEHDLHHAVDAGRLRLHYQPVVNLADGQMAGVEALLRLDHPTRGLLGPPDFLDVAESSGLIIPIGGWVIAEACRQQAAWQASLDRPLQMAVNLSGRQLLQADLCEHVSAIIDGAAMDPARLTLELTETVFTQASRSFLADLETLKARGVRFALDDFGTGYSSLAYLERFPVDVVKIGPTFVAGLGITTQDSTLVTAIVNLGHALHLTVVAEGVETPDQLAALQDMGCDLVQGFHFARPSPAERIPGLLAAIRHPPSAIRNPAPRTGARR